MAGEWLPLAIVWSGLYQHKQRHFPRWCNSVTTSTGLCPQTTFILIYLSWSVCSGSVSSVSSILDDETGTLGGRCFIAEYHRPCSSIGRAAICEIWARLPPSQMQVQILSWSTILAILLEVQCPSTWVEAPQKVYIFVHQICSSIKPKGCWNPCSYVKLVS